MHSVSFPARLTRRFAAGSVALATVLAGVGFAASPAHASTSSTGYCLRATTAQDFGQIVQYQCDDSDNLQNWTATQVAVPNGDTPPPDNGILIQDRNNSTGYCLDADAQQIQDFGSIISWQCSPSDPYQLWIISSNSTGIELENYGAWLYHGASYCFDADAQQVQDYGAVIQWPCGNLSDPYQLWYPLASDYHVQQNVGASA
jgi:Ricin-type beta-trefoil lectin domain